MNMKKLLAACAVSALALVGSAGVANAQKGAFTINIDGSSTVFPISEAAASGFQAAQGGKVRVTVGESGTGGGFKKFCRGETHISDASRPIKASEMAACSTAGVKYVEVPVAFDALTVVVNPASPVSSATVADLKKAWEPGATGKVTKWNQVNAAWPDAPLTLYGPGTASGTFDYFTEAVNGKSGASRTDYTPSEDDNVLVQGVAGDKNAMGYFGLAYYLGNKDKLKGLAIDGGKGPVAPSVEAVKSGKYVPLARPIFIYVNAAALSKKPVADFVNYYLDNATALVTKVNYVPLPASAYTAYKARVAAKQIGTAFGGKADVGASIEEVMARKLVKTAE